MFKLIFSDAATTRHMLWITSLLTGCSLFGSIAFTALDPQWQPVATNVLTSVCARDWIAFVRCLFLPSFTLLAWYALRYLFLHEK